MSGTRPPPTRGVADMCFFVFSLGYDTATFIALRYMCVISRYDICILYRVTIMTTLLSYTDISLTIVKQQS